MEKIFNALINNTPLAVVVIGLALVLTGASGGVEKLSLKVQDPIWRIALAAIGGVVAGLGALLLLRPKHEVGDPIRASEYKLRITQPLEGATVETRVQVVGTYERMPEEDSVMLIEQSTRSGQYWFKRQPVFDNDSKRWFADWNITGSTNRDVFIYVAVLGKAGRALAEYYFRVGETTQQWPGIKTLPPDVVMCDHVRVIRK
jgi:hypothetical protein